MRVGIVGSRDAGNVSFDLIRDKIPPNCKIIVSGGAVGIDSMAEKVAKDLNIPFVKYLPNYEIFGSQAPMIRNTKIVENSDRVLAFWNYKSRGTAHTIKECIRLGVPVEIVSIKNANIKGGKEDD